MTPMIAVRGLVWFTAGDVLLTREGIAAATDDPEALLDAIRDAARYIGNQHLRDACGGGFGPLKDYSELDFDEFVAILAEIETAERIATATKDARLAAMKQRRREFAYARADLVLRMLDSGVAYVCAHEGCHVAEKLTVDHILPISRGGTDDLSNLQFMCASHNSAKGNRAP